MPFFDYSLEELKKYRPQIDEPSDFDAFWAKTIDKANDVPLEAHYSKVETALKFVDIFDLTFAGYAGQSISAWLVLPTQIKAPLTCIVEYKKYSESRGFFFENLLWSNLGYAHLVMDTRGQGWSKIGKTTDTPNEEANPHVPGVMTQGILKTESYYYRRLFVDAYRAIQVAKQHPLIDAQRIIATGYSQGGGVTLAVAGLDPELFAIMPNLPFLCHYKRATEIVENGPYQEIVRYCQTYRDHLQTVFHTLSYFDGVNFAKRAKTKSLFSVALMDDICPPSTVFAAYNHYAGEKDIAIWKYNKHEGGEQHQIVKQLNFIQSLT